MFCLPGYTTTAEIHESVYSKAFRAIRDRDGQRVIVKALKDEYPPPFIVVKVKREYEITRSLHHLSCVVKVLALESLDNRMALVTEDFGGESLKKWMQKGEMPLPIKLHIALEVARGLGQIHDAWVIHKDINPANIVYDPQTQTVKLIDFGLATRVPRERAGVDRQNRLEGTLAYISPEQTGKTQFSVDYRTDYYSFGATLYQLFTGRLPFEVRDPSALIHCQLAKSPDPPHGVNPEVPEVLSQIILRLLAKTPDDRYQSARGIQTDLDKCLEQVRMTRTVTSFPIAANDFSERLTIPEKLYGRQAELQILGEVFARVGQGSTGLALVSGYSGAGKTSLVSYLIPALNQRRGHFAEGKFGELQRGKPYSALVCALSALVRKLLAEPDEALAAWKGKLEAALGQNGQVIAELIPDLTHIIGPQPALPLSEPAERQNRFSLMFLRFIEVLSQPEHPLILFLDDLQWADCASLRLMELLLTAKEARSVLLIGAYRDNEVDSAHPLMLMLEHLAQQGVPLTRLSLSALGVGPVNQLLADTLRSSAEDTRPLAEVLLEKTGGNPFFLKEYLNSLHEEGLLSIERQTGRWQWDLLRIAKQGITDNVADLVVAKIQKLEPQSRELLKHAACLGNQLDVRTLSWVSARSPPETVTGLWPVVSCGLLIPLSQSYRAVEQGEYRLGQEGEVLYRFAHDRIRQAAYSLIPEIERPAQHLGIARCMVGSADDKEREARIFDVAQHLQLARACLAETPERLRWMALLLEAGRKAKDSAAFQPAMGYLQEALTLARAGDWETSHELMMSLHAEAAEAAYLTSDYGRMEQLVSFALDRTRGPLERARLMTVRMHACILQDQLQEAVGIGLDVLALFGIRFPRQPGLGHVALELARTLLLIRGKKAEHWLSLPVVSDPQRIAALRMLVTTGSAGYLVNIFLYALIVLRGFRETVRHGNSPVSAVPYTGLGVLLCGVLGDYRRGHEYAEVGLRALDRFGEERLRSFVLFGMGNFVLHWRAHLRETLPVIVACYQCSLERGDLQFVCFSAANYGYHAYMAGFALPEVSRDLVKYRPVIERYGRRLTLNTSSIYLQAVLNLIKPSPEPCRLLGEVYDEDRMIPEHHQRAERLNLFDLWFNKLILGCVFQEYDQALLAAREVRRLVDLVPGTFSYAAFFFYDSLAVLGAHDRLCGLERFRAWQRVRANQKKLRRFAASAPMNHRHKYLLVAAERLRVQGAFLRAVSLYQEAIALARQHEYLQEEAQAAELLSCCYRQQQRGEQALRSMQDARYAYLKWGALAKVTQLDRAHASLDELLGPKPPLRKTSVRHPGSP